MFHPSFLSVVGAIAISFSLGNLAKAQSSEPLAAVSFDWDHDGRLDTFSVLPPVLENGQYPIHIQMGNGNVYSNLRFLVMVPKLSIIDSNGTVEISSKAEFWSSGLRVSYRDSLFMIDEMSYQQSFKSLTGECKVSFQTGKAIANKHEISLEKRDVVLARSPKGGVTQALVAVCLELMDKNPE